MVEEAVKRKSTELAPLEDLECEVPLLFFLSFSFPSLAFPFNLLYTPQALHRKWPFSSLLQKHVSSTPQFIQGPFSALDKNLVLRIVFNRLICSFNCCSSWVLVASALEDLDLIKRQQALHKRFFWASFLHIGVSVVSHKLQVFGIVMYVESRIGRRVVEEVSSRDGEL